jgi:hypothetical protein
MNCTRPMTVVQNGVLKYKFLDFLEPNCENIEFVSLLKMRMVENILDRKLINLFLGKTVRVAVGCTRHSC